MPRRSQVDMGLSAQAVNLGTIAQRLGISVSTASRALRNIPGIHPTTRSRVVDLAAELGYRLPTREADRRPSRQILVLSLIRQQDADEKYLAGLSRAAVSLDATLLAHHYLPEECGQVLHARSRPPALRDRTVDGIVLLHRWPDEIVRELASRTPLVSIVHGYRAVDVDLVGTDDREGIFVLVRHLRERGHERIGFFGLAPAMSWSRARFAAYVEALAELGLEWSREDVIPVSLEEALAEDPIDLPEAGPLLLRRVREAGVKAWIGASDVLGQSACRGLMQQGLRAGADVAITGYHAGLRPYFGLPRLTSTTISSEELGSAALRRLLTRLENPHETRRTILLPAALQLGETT